MIRKPQDAAVHAVRLSQMLRFHGEEAENLDPALKKSRQVLELLIAFYVQEKGILSHMAVFQKAAT